MFQAFKRLGGSKGAGSLGPESVAAVGSSRDALVSAEKGGGSEVAGESSKGIGGMERGGGSGVKNSRHKQLRT